MRYKPIVNRNTEVRPRLPRWRRSADRASLRANSLLTGNFTGNFAILELREETSTSDRPVSQPLLSFFATQADREIFLQEQGILVSNRGYISLLSSEAPPFAPGSATTVTSSPPAAL